MHKSVFGLYACGIEMFCSKVYIGTSFVTFAPNSQPAPLGLIAQVSTSSGSDQTRSQNAPLWGISWFLSMVRIWSRVLMSGESPPCTQRICSSINYGLSEANNHQYNAVISYTKIYVYPILFQFIKE